MPNILALLQTNLSGISKTTLRQMNQVITAMLSMTGRVTMLGISRWAGKGGSYRTIQRFYSTVIPWAQVLWQFFRQTLFRSGETYILAGDECVDSKAGKKTYGLDCFFSGLQCLEQFSQKRIIMSGSIRPCLLVKNVVLQGCPTLSVIREWHVQRPLIEQNPVL